jgi:hypothetical protein
MEFENSNYIESEHELSREVVTLRIDIFSRLSKALINEFETELMRV